MIRHLAREQLRSQKRFIAWTGGMLVAVLTLATYSAVMSATEHQNNRNIYAITGADDAQHAYAASYVDRSGDDTANAEAGVTPLATVDDAIDQAVEGGSDLQATRRIDVFVVDPSDFGSGLVAMTGDVDWDSLMVAGTPPTAGQVAISGRIANQLGVGIGDGLAAVGDYVSVEDGGSADFEPQHVTLTVSGITRSSVSPSDYGDSLPEAFASWDDSAALTLTGDPTVTESQGSGVVTTDVSWNVGSPDLGVFSMELDGRSLSVTSVSLATQASALLAWALAIGLLIMAVAIGRNQAQARVAWVGTARAMGARRSTIARATVFETLAIGLGAAGIGGALGLVSVTVSQAILRSGVPDPLYPSAPVIPAWVMAAIVGLGVVLATLIGAVPAFWASRIEPVDALKPAEARLDHPPADPVSRQRTRKVVLYAWIASLVALVCLRFAPALSEGPQLPTTLVTIAVVALSAAVAYRILTAAVRGAGERLSNSRRIWAIATGAAWRTRPVQAAVPALLFAAVLTPMTLLTATLLRQDEYSYAPADNSGLSFGIWSIVMLAAVVALIVATIVALAVFSSGARATRGDTATRSALGMSLADERKSRFVWFWLSLAIGAAFGLVFGIALTVAMWGVDAITIPSFLNHFGGVDALVAPLLGVVALHAIALLLAAGGGALVAATTSRKTPVQELSHA